MNPENPLLSIVIRVVGGGAFLERCLTHLVSQMREDIEIIVPFDASAPEIKSLVPRFPNVIFRDLGTLTVGESASPALAHQIYDLRTSAGFRAARGQIIALLEDNAIPAPDWCAQILAAHQLEHAVIGGAVEHAGRGSLNWAIYFLDFGRYQLPLREGPVNFLTDVNVSYKRRALEMTRERWAERYNEVTVHWALLAQNVTLWMRPQIIVSLDRGAVSLARALRERYEWGRLFGFVRVREISLARRFLLIAASPLIPLVMLWRNARRVWKFKRHRREFVAALPYMLVLAAAWGCGELAAYITGREISVGAKILAVSENP